MKYFVGYFLSLIFASNLFASNLCDSSCNLSITFPDGGSIEAVKTLTVTFGDGGYVNDGVVMTEYSAGDALSLAAGEAINFQANGSFEIGTGGNIDYSNILIVSNGVMNLAAIGNSEKVLIQDMILLGTATLNISSNFEILESGSFQIFTSPVATTADLVFTNYGFLSGLFVFNNATLTVVEETLDVEETIDISGSLLIDTDSELTMRYTEAATRPAPTVTEEEGAAEASVSASGGFINLFSLFVMFLLLISHRFISIIRNRKY